MAGTAASGRADAAPTSPESTDIKQADALFAEGRALMDKGLLDEACPKLERSFLLAPRLGTMLNVGACFEQSGRLARALAMYERAATMGREAGRPDRERAARDLAAALEPRVAKLLLVIDHPSPGLAVDIDGEPLPTRVVLVPIDPGQRAITVRAPNKRAWTTSISAAAGVTVRVAVPELEDEAPSPAPPSPAAPSSADRSSVVRTAGITTGLGVAAVGLTIGTIFGLTAKAKHDDASSHCDLRTCDDEGLALIDDAKRSGNLATGAFVGAGVGLAAAAVFFFVAKPSGASVGVGPARNAAGMELRAIF